VAKIAMNYLQTALSPTMQPMVPQPQTFGISPMQGMPQQIMMVMPQPGLSQLSPQKKKAQTRQSMENDKPGGPDVSGVGIFFQERDQGSSSAFVHQIVPRSSADRCGMILMGDELLAAGEVGQKPTNIEGKGLGVLREKILGPQGSFVVLHFRRKNKGDVYEIELMRGSPEYIEMMNVSTGLKDRQQNDMIRIQELENQVSNLKQQVQAYAAQAYAADDPRIGPLEDELRARMDDLRRFEDMLLRAKDRTSEALRARDDAVEQLEMMKRTQALETKSGQIAVEDSDEFRELQKQLGKATSENAAIQRGADELYQERKELKQERDELKQQLRNFKEEVEAQKKQLQAELGRMQSNNNSKEMEELKEQLRVRNQRDQDISRRLRNGHNTISQALREQQLAAAAALEVLPCVDVIHDSFLSTFQADFLSMQPLDALSMPVDPQIQRGVNMEIKRHEFA